MTAKPKPAGTYAHELLDNCAYVYYGHSAEQIAEMHALITQEMSTINATPELFNDPVIVATAAMIRAYITLWYAIDQFTQTANASDEKSII